MTELSYWRHRVEPRHVTTVDMTGTMNAPQWEPVRVLNGQEFLGCLPTRDEIAEVMIAVSPDAAHITDDEREWYLRDADAVLALIQSRMTT